MNKTPCPKIGIKIHESNNEYKTNPFVSNSTAKPIYNSRPEQKIPDICYTNNFDLNIDNYSIRDIFRLFNIQSELLNEDVYERSKKNLY